MNTWNRHIHTGTQNVHNVHNAHIDNIGIPKHKKLLRLLSSRTKHFITFELKVIRHKESDTQSFYADFSICAPTSTTCGTPPQTTGLISASHESQPFSSDAKTQQTDFSQIPKILRARFRCMTSFTPPGHIFIRDFYFDISKWHILLARAWTTALMLHLTNPCAKRKVLSLTKPKGKIYKTKSLGHYIAYIYKCVCMCVCVLSKLTDRSQAGLKGCFFWSYFTEM